MYTGILRYSDIGTGGWSLECSDGITYTLMGTIPKHLHNKQVSIKAKPMQGMGFMMNGPILQVEEVSEY
tara:strand:+ start:348 stop:554 length:207 start_codon:yes stop_codon:yes gene_type:complete